MKALVLAPLDPESLSRLRQRGEVVYEPWLETELLWDPEELGARLAAEGFSALIIEADFVLEETLTAAPGLRFIGVCRGEIGPHVDLQAAAKRGVVVANTPGRNAVAVAELAVGLILALARRIPAAAASVREGHWLSPLEGYTAWRGSELAGKTAGLIGLGAVGREVARRLVAFDMNVVAHDPHSCVASPSVTMLPLDALLRSSDYVSVHAALTPETRGLLGGRELLLMRPGTRLVNTARAAIVDEAALLAALAEGRLAGAALDVHEIEPLPPNSPWLKLDNVILTPHMGGASEEVVRRQSSLLVDDIERWLRGERPLHAVV